MSPLFAGNKPQFPVRTGQYQDFINGFLALNKMWVQDYTYFDAKQTDRETIVLWAFNPYGEMDWLLEVPIGGILYTKLVTEGLNEKVRKEIAHFESQNKYMFSQIEHWEDTILKNEEKIRELNKEIK